MVAVHISHPNYKYLATPEEKSTLSELINVLLEPILLDCITFNASVNAIVTQSGNYKIESICDQYSTLVVMQSLLPEIIPSFK
jgi:hypothetical protein